LFKDDTSIEEECLIDERKEKSSPRIVHESENPSDCVALPQLEKKSQKLSLTKTTLPLMEECIQKTDLPAYVSIPILPYAIILRTYLKQEGRSLQCVPL
jgi:hypothetical protein